MRTRIVLSLAVLLCSTAVIAQQQGSVAHTAASCILAGEMPLMGVQLVDDGLLRAYFRRVNTTDWCSVDGQNLGKASTVTLPKFDVGTEIEYYFVVLKGKQVVAKSPVIYRVKALDRCDSLYARHAILLVQECLPPGQNPIADSLAAGYRTTSVGPHPNPPVQSPEKPERQ